MKITKHITFFYIEERIQYLNKIIHETNNYKYHTDIFIHTNTFDWNMSLLNKYTNGNIQMVLHDLTNENPFYLAWKCRDLLYNQRNDYDIFMYIEDDILVPWISIQYWLEHNEFLIEHNLNLGFLRIEINDTDGEEYTTDVHKLDTYIELDKEYCINNNNPYCAFWIYNNKEFNRFVNSKYYNLKSTDISQSYIREMSAIGLHAHMSDWYKGILIPFWYKGTVIPLIDGKLDNRCKIYHLPNNYTNNPHTYFGKVKYKDILR